MNSASERIGCIILDDEPLAIDVLTGYIEKTSFLQLIGTFDHPLKALAAIKGQAIDLVFLDIDMPEVSGLEVATFLNTLSKVIFVTALPNYALQGFELNAVDYLLKPVSFQRFLKAVNKVWKPEQLNLSISNEIKSPSVSVTEEVLFIRADHRIVKVFLSSILFIEGLREYIAVHTVEKKLISLQSMKKIEDVLPRNRFVRVHKSYIVAIDKIDFVNRNNVFIKNTSIPIGETYKETFFKLLNSNNLL